MKPWHLQARRLKDRGTPISEIAAQFGVTRETVKWATDDDFRLDNRDRTRRNREREYRQRADRWIAERDPHLLIDLYALEFGVPAPARGEA